MTDSRRLPTDIIAKILLELAPDSPFRYARVSKQWFYGVIKKQRFWQMFMAKVFDQPELNTSLLNLAQIWKQILMTNSPFTRNHNNINITSEQYQYRVIDRQMIIKYFKDYEKLTNFGPQYDFLHVQINPHKSDRLSARYIYLGLVPIIFNGTPGEGCLYSMTLPRCTRTESFFQKIIEIEDKMSAELVGTNITFIRRIKDPNKNWFNINMSGGKYFGFESIEINSNHTTQSFLFPHAIVQTGVPCLSPRIVTQGVVSICISRLWTKPKDKTMGLMLNNLAVAFFPMNIPQEWKKYRRPLDRPEKCRCPSCLDNVEWQHYLDDYGNEEFRHANVPDLLGLEEFEPDIDSQYKKYRNYIPNI